VCRNINTCNFQQFGYDLAEVATFMPSRFLLLICTVSIAMPSFAQQERNLAAREELNQGVQAYRAANYGEAIRHFENVVQMDPQLKVGRLYLATAYAQQYVPGVETPDNIEFARKAIDQYNEILRGDSQNISAAKGVAYLHLQLKRFDEARADYKKAIASEPNDPELYYSVGVVDWSIAYKEIMEEKSKNNLGTDDSMIQQPSCKQLRGAQLANVEDGIAMLARAIDLRKNYDDAMVYVNLLYRLRADLQCGDPAAQAEDIKKANEWSDMAMAARRAKAKKEEEEQKTESTKPN